MTPDFPYDVAAMVARMLKHARKHARLCRDEVVNLRAENERLKILLLKANHERSGRDHSCEA